MGGVKVDKSSTRLFLALWPDPELQCELAGLQVRAEVRATGGRIVPNEDLHITLQFLGEVDFSRRAAMMTWLPEFIFAPVTLTLDRIGYWPRSGIVWLGPQNTPHELVEGVQRLSNRLRAFGFSANRRGLKAHITVARNARSMKRFDFAPLIMGNQESCSRCLRAPLGRCSLLGTCMVRFSLNSAFFLGYEFRL